MTDTLRHQAIGALALLHHTSHQVKATVLKAHVKGLEAQSQIALERTAQLQAKGWRLVQSPHLATILRFRHPRLFYDVNLRPNGDAVFWLMRVPDPHVIGAQDADAFEAYLKTLDRGEQRSLRFAKCFLAVAVAILVAVIAQWMAG